MPTKPTLPPLKDDRLGRRRSSGSSNSSDVMSMYACKKMRDLALNIKKQNYKETRVEMTEMLDLIEGGLSQQSAMIQEREVACRAREIAAQEQQKFNIELGRRLQTQTESLCDREREFERRVAEASGHGAASVAGHGKVKKGRKKTPMDNVPALVEQFHARGGQVPLGVCVAEVGALQQASTRLQNVANNAHLQLQQLEERGTLPMSEYRRVILKNSQAELEQQKKEANDSADFLLKRFDNLRDEAIQRFVPMLMETVAKFDAAFESHLTAEGEVALENIAALSRTVRTKGRQLRQPLPTSNPGTSLQTLMRLMGYAMHAQSRLCELVRNMVGNREGVEVVSPVNPVKGILRCLQKAQEEYGGDYTRILDLSRVTVVFDDVVMLEKCMRWLLSEERLPNFKICRIKDRLSRGFDAEMSGGNRDIMMNGHLVLGGGRMLIVEVQLHVRKLFELKADLHVLYAGARVLGAMEDSCAKHNGKLTSDVLKRVERGVVRKMYCSYSPAKPKVVKKLIRLFQREPNPLLEVDLAYCKMDHRESRKSKNSTAPLTKKKMQVPIFDEFTLSQVLLGLNVRGPLKGLRTFACRNLRYLNMRNCGLDGSIPKEIGRSVWLEAVNLAGNYITGPIPMEMGDCRRLWYINLEGNDLSGLVPWDLKKCTNLLAISVNKNQRLLVTKAVKDQLEETINRNLEKSELNPEGLKALDHWPAGDDLNVKSCKGDYDRPIGVYSWCDVVGGDIAVEFTNDDRNSIDRLKSLLHSAVKMVDMDEVRNISIRIEKKLTEIKNGVEKNKGKSSAEGSKVSAVDVRESSSDESEESDDSDNNG